MSFCTKCGNQMPDGSAFCTKCGNKMAGAAPAAQAPVQPQMQPQMQQQFQQPQYQQPAAPQVSFSQAIKSNAKLMKILFLVSNALIILSCMVPYVSYYGHALNRLANEGLADGFGLLMITLSFFTIVMCFTLKNKKFITATAGYNTVMTLIAIISGDKMFGGNGFGHVMLIISFFMLAVTTVCYFISTDDK